MTDFELAAINSFQGAFPQSTPRGCFFHHNQSVWRRIQALGLQHRYQQDDVFALQAKMLPALAFVPTQDVITAFEILTENHMPAELDPLITYFEDNWIGRQQRRQRRRPMFPVDLWNCHDAVRAGK